MKLEIIMIRFTQGRMTAKNTGQTWDLSIYEDLAIKKHKKRLTTVSTKGCKDVSLRER